MRFLGLLTLFASLILASMQLSISAGEQKKDAKQDEKKKEQKDTVVNDELTNADLTDKSRTTSFCKTYVFKMTEGRTYQIDMISNAFDSYLRLENSDSAQVAADDDSGGFPHARMVYRAPKTGDFTIICTTFSGGTTGKYTLHVKDLQGKQPAPPKGKIVDKIFFDKK